MSAPDLTTEVVGYRQWYVTPDLELRSAGLAKPVLWHRGDQTATCRRTKQTGPRGYYETPVSLPDPCGDVPGENCECGFYALHSPSDHWYGKPRNDMWGMMEPPRDVLVSGIIVAWGTLQVHHQGFRAQYARIAALALPNTKRDQVVARAVAGAYGVPCVPAVDLPKIAAEFGGTVPVEFRPDKPEPKNTMAASYAQALKQVWMNPPSPFWTYSTIPLAPPIPQPTPKVSAETRRRMELLASVKKESNRQGPPKPKRAPRNLG